jgi:hypothetical protein
MVRIASGVRRKTFGGGGTPECRKRLSKGMHDSVYEEPVWRVFCFLKIPLILLYELMLEAFVGALCTVAWYNRHKRIKSHSIIHCSLIGTIANTAPSLFNA